LHVDPLAAGRTDGAHEAGVKVDPEVLAKAAEDQRKRDEKKPEATVPALPLRGK